MESLGDTPVVLLNGARQTGKSTLVHQLARQKHPARYLTFDDPGAFSAAKNDPPGFIAGFDEPVILDEVQRVPELFPAIKIEVDRNRRPGRFLLTGSADVMLLPQLSESLTGRVEIHTLWPLSPGEINSSTGNFIDMTFADRFKLPPSQELAKDEAIALVSRGGYPEVLGRRAPHRHRAWFDAYITTILQRDVRDIANIEDLTALPRLLALLSARTASLVNYAEISRSTGIPQSTLKRYLALLEMTFLYQPLPAWNRNLSQRIVKSPKIILTDTGLLVHLLGFSEGKFFNDPDRFGPLFENYIVMELRKQSTWSQTRPRIFHFRTAKGREVDILLEDQTGKVVGVEVKASAKVDVGDFRGLKFLADTLGPAFRRGIVLYLGQEAIPFGQDLLALPISALWASHP